jgi:hypothetical protein
MEGDLGDLLNGATNEGSYELRIRLPNRIVNSLAAGPIVDLVVDPVQTQSIYRWFADCNDGEPRKAILDPHNRSLNMPCVPAWL